MDPDDIRVFIDKLNIQLNMFSFDYMATVAMPFSDLARTNIVSDKAFRSLNLPERFRGRMLKELLKCVGIGSHHASDLHIQFEDEELIDALHHLNEFLEKENLKKLRLVLSNSRDKEELEIGLGIHLLSKLAGNAFTSTKKSLRSCPCGCLEKLQSTEKMWIGSENTWYGELDIITGNPAVGSSVSVSFDPETEVQEKIVEGISAQSEDEDEDQIDPKDDGENESPGDRTNVEVKYCRADSTDIRTKLNQVVAQAVVFAFTEYNRHKSKGTCIPSIMMDKSGFQFVIYNPLDDILLVSNYIMFADDASFDIASGYGPFVLLWIILNYRIFFLKHPDFQTHCVKSGFHKKWSDMDHFHNLVEYSKSITLDRTIFFPDDTPKIMTDEGFYYFFKRKTSS